MIGESGMTEKEEKVADDLIKAHNGFCKLPKSHPDERKEWIFGMHILQGLLMQRVTRRLYPKYWRNEDEKII